MLIKRKEIRKDESKRTTAYELIKSASSEGAEGELSGLGLSQN